MKSKNIKSKNSRLIISADSINSFGDVIFDLFIAWELSAQTGKFMNAVYVIGSSVAFRALLSFFMGSFVDKHPKKKLIIISHISSIAVIVVFGVFFGLAKQFVAIGILFVLLNDINNEMFLRSGISMTADMFNDNEFIKFQSYSTIVTRIVGIGGAAIAGFLIDTLPGYAIFSIDIVTYLFSLALMLCVKYAENIEELKIESKKKNNILKVNIADIKFTFSNIIHSAFLTSFICLMFILNLAYGYIPQLLPLLKANMAGSVTLLGVIKSSLMVGEILGMGLVVRLSRYVSRTFKISMIANIVIMGFVYLTNNAYMLVVLFALYGLSDSLTQPLFSYAVSNLDSRNRGKLLGGIDSIILFSPSIGIYAISALSNYSPMVGGSVVILIFVSGLIIVHFNKNLNNIVLRTHTDDQ